MGKTEIGCAGDKDERKSRENRDRTETNEEDTGEAEEVVNGTNETMGLEESTFTEDSGKPFESLTLGPTYAERANSLIESTEPKSPCGSEGKEGIRDTLEKEITCGERSESTENREDIETEGEMATLEFEPEKDTFAMDDAGEKLGEGETASEKGLEKDGDGEKLASGEVDVVQAESKPGDDPSEGRDTPKELYEKSCPSGNEESSTDENLRLRLRRCGASRAGE